jgi:EmrB/QacA subfamily drug resistance transporter
MLRLTPGGGVLILTRNQRLAVIGAALLALFLGALDALIISAAMPTIVADLGGLHLYSWVYSAYFLSRAVSLPIFGKLADLFKCRMLFLASIGTFLLASVAAGCAWNMTALILARVVQGVGAGGIFALVYIILADVANPEKRGRTLSTASSVWGIASVLGPTLGGIIVSYGSWRWVFFLNLPLGAVSLWGIGRHFTDLRPKKAKVDLDLQGVATLSTAILAFLFAMLLGGRSHPWGSPLIIGLLGAAILGLLVFIYTEKNAPDPILPIAFFGNRGFAAGNAAVFLSSFAIFSLFAFAPLFIQGVQGKSPLQVGTTMVSLSLGWSLGSMALGQVIDRLGYRSCALAGGLVLVAGCALSLTFAAASPLWYSFGAFFIVGAGMGFVALSTLLVVQACLAPKDLGVATASNQFARTLGGTVGVGVCGGFMAARLSGLKAALGNAETLDRFSAQLAAMRTDQIGEMLRPEIQALMPPAVRQFIRDTLFLGARDVFWAVVVAALLCLVTCLLIPRRS